MNWKKVYGCELQYEVSDSGVIRRLNGTIVGQWVSDQGYCLARLSNPRKTVRVHRVVAEAFCKNPDAKRFVNHIDCNRENNKANNLEWCTQWENLMHSQNLGRMQRDFWKGKRSPNAKLSDDVVNQIRSDYSNGNVSWAALGARYNVSKRTIGRIVKGESYA